MKIKNIDDIYESYCTDYRKRFDISGKDYLILKVEN